jgi:hypothetical protein
MPAREHQERPGSAPSPAKAPRQTPATAQSPASVAVAFPQGLSPREILALQRSVGNAAVARLIADDETVQRDAMAMVDAATRTPGSPLPAPVRHEMENDFGGEDFSSVRSHVDRESAEAIGAKAYTTKTNHIVFRSVADMDDHTLRHELEHFRQQRAGRASSGLSDPMGKEETAAEDTAIEIERRKGSVQRAWEERPPVHKRAVQRLQANAGSPAVASLTVQRMDEGLTLGANTSGRSKAADPAFEAEAEEFERKLAAKASAHKSANDAMADMAAKARAYIRSGVGVAWEHADQQLAEIFRLVGQEGVEKSGFVGTAVADVMAVFDEGTLSERYTHIVRFFTEVLARDLASPAKRQEIDKRMKEADLNLTFLRHRRREMAKAGKDQATVTTRDIAPVPAGSAVEHQGAARVRRNDVLKALDPDRQPDDGRAGHTVAQTGLEFSDRQEAMHTRDDPAWDREQDILKWLAGTRVWMIDERNAWVQAQRKMSLPLGGGPSGTTTTMMNAAEALGGEKYGARLASIAFLVGASHHTLVEIMAAAEPFGCVYTPGQDIYRNVRPLTEQELRACGREGRFPGEPAPAAAGTGP